MNKITQQFLMTCIILTGTIGVASAQVTVAESEHNTVQSGTPSGDMHYNESQRTIAKDGNGGTAIRTESVTHDRRTTNMDKMAPAAGTTARPLETQPTGAVHSDEIRRTNTGRTLHDNQ